MRQEINGLRACIDSACGRRPADILLRNAKIFNVYTGEWFVDNLAITSGSIIGWGDYTAYTDIDCTGKFVTPGFIDSHVHIESSTLCPAEFTAAILRCGTTTAICDPHEIANATGVKGIEYMLAATEQLPANFYIMLPSCVPASPFEYTGYCLEANELSELIKHPRVLGLGELMNYHGVENAEPKLLDKVCLARLHGKRIDGHAPQEADTRLNAYLCSGAATDHEAVSLNEAREKLGKGVYIQIREGTLCRNLLDLLPMINTSTLRRYLFCTDDRTPEHIFKEGHINSIVKAAAQAGLPLEQALTIATLNAAECYGLNHLGALAPGKQADILIFDNLDELVPSTVLQRGRIVYQNNRYCLPIAAISLPEVLTNSIRAAAVQTDQLTVRASGSVFRVIETVPFQAYSRECFCHLPCENGVVMTDPQQDIAKIVVIERHKSAGKIGCGFVKGLGIKKGAIAQTIAHDSHNIIAVGIEDAEIAFAVNELIKQGGGLLVSDNCRVIAALPLAIAGLMSTDNAEQVVRKTSELHIAAQTLGISPDNNPFISLGFLCLSVIPELKMTAGGLCDVRTGELCRISVNTDSP